MATKQEEYCNGCGYEFKDGDIVIRTPPDQRWCLKCYDKIINKG